MTGTLPNLSSNDNFALYIHFCLNSVPKIHSLSSPDSVVMAKLFLPALSLSTAFVESILLFRLSKSETPVVLFQVQLHEGFCFSA